MIIYNESFLILIAFLLGITAKYADLVNEHGMKEHFKWGGIIAGFLWGLFGALILYVSPLAGITYLAHVLYWFQKIKLEYPNHALAGVMILLAGFFLQGDVIFQHRNDLVILYFSYTSTGYLQAYFKTNFKSSNWFWRLRLRIYIIPLLYSFYIGDSSPFIANLAGMFGCEIMTFLYRGYQNDIYPLFPKG